MAILKSDPSRGSISSGSKPRLLAALSARSRIASTLSAYPALAQVGAS